MNATAEGIYTFKRVCIGDKGVRNMTSGRQDQPSIPLHVYPLPNGPSRGGHVCPFAGEF